MQFKWLGLVVLLLSTEPPCQPETDFEFGTSTPNPAKCMQQSKVKKLQVKE